MDALNEFIQLDPGQRARLWYVVVRRLRYDGSIVEIRATHAHLGRALEWIERVKPAHAVLTNMHIDLDYQTLKARLPSGVEPAYDGWAGDYSI